jgi:hypothetical protein
MGGEINNFNRSTEFDTDLKIRNARPAGHRAGARISPQTESLMSHCCQPPARAAAGELGLDARRDGFPLA